MAVDMPNSGPSSKGPYLAYLLPFYAYPRQKIMTKNTSCSSCG